MKKNKNPDLRNKSQPAPLTFSFLLAILITTLWILPLPLRAQQTPETLVGVLVLKTSGKETWLGIQPKSYKGQLNPLLQIAGLDPQQWAQAKNLIGMEIQATGMPMERHSIHHHTPTLWLTQALFPTHTPPANNTPSKSEEKKEKPRSHEW